MSHNMVKSKISNRA